LSSSAHALVAREKHDRRILIKLVADKKTIILILRDVFNLMVSLNYFANLR